jgi:DNA-binding transcriptional LysR family regulator
MSETIVRLDDMRLFAELARAGSLSAAARTLAMPKQTVSRRLAQLEDALGVQLAQRTTRRLRLTQAGVAYAERCAEVARLAEEANRAVADVAQIVQGTLRLTADPTFGEAFVPDLVAEFTAAHPQVRVDIVLTTRFVDLVEEGFDLAFRVGRMTDSSLVGTRLGAARLRYCAAPEYLRRRGTPESIDELSEHDCIENVPQPGPSRWPLLVDGKIVAVPVRGRIRVNALPLALRAARAGLGIANLPAFACADDVAAGRLVPVLDAHAPDVGGVWIVYPAHRFLAPRVRRFVDLGVERFRGRDW